MRFKGDFNLNLQKLILTENACYKAGKTITVKGIMVHSTGANNPYLKRYVGPDDGKLGKNKFGNHWNTRYPDGRKVCPHAFIGLLEDGTVATYQTLPWNMRGWHAGGKGNDTLIGFEICEDGLTDKKYFNKVYAEASELCAYLCKKYSLTEKDIICHCEGYTMGIATNHADVMHWFKKHGKTMDTFRSDVKALIEKCNKKNEKDSADKDTLYRVRKNWSDAKSQIGAFRSLKNAKKACDKNEGTFVFDFDGKIVYPKEEKTDTTDSVKGYSFST